jgi:hypothetical protein
MKPDVLKILGHLSQLSEPIARAAHFAKYPALEAHYVAEGMESAADRLDRACDAIEEEHTPAGLAELHAARRALDKIIMTIATNMGFVGDKAKAERVLSKISNVLMDTLEEVHILAHNPHYRYVFTDTPIDADIALIRENLEVFLD